MPDDAKQTPVEPRGDARSLGPTDQSAGGEDSSPLEAVPSGEKEQAAEQNLPPGRLQPPARP